jgi:hypothetical protein
MLIFKRDGGDQCAMFAASCILLNSIIVAKAFDVAEVVRQLRKSKENLIRKFDLYQYLYDLCRDFNEQTANNLILVDEKLSLHQITTRK